MPSENIWLAASDGLLEDVKRFIEEQGISPNAKDENTYTPMHAAASYGHIKVLEYLVAQGGDVNITDDDRDTPLFTVESIPVARWLVDHGASTSHRNSEGLTAADHLSEDFPAVANFLLSLGATSLTDAPPPPVLPIPAIAPQQEAHFTNEQSEALTRTLLERAEQLKADYTARGEEPDEDAIERELIQLVGRTVLEGVTEGAAWAIDREENVDTTAADTEDAGRTRPPPTSDDSGTKRRRIGED